MNNKVLTNILNSINCFVSDYRSDLYGYLLESDVQAALFSKLRKDINTSVEVAGLAENKTYKLNLIYTEYLDLFDICCLNQEEVKLSINQLFINPTKSMTTFYITFLYSLRLN